MVVLAKICLGLAAMIVVAFLICLAIAMGPNPGQGFLLVFLWVVGPVSVLVLTLVAAISYSISKFPLSATVLSPLDIDPGRQALWVGGVIAAMAAYQFLARVAFHPRSSWADWLVFLTMAVGAGVLLLRGIKSIAQSPAAEATVTGPGGIGFIRLAGDLPTGSVARICALGGCLVAAGLAAYALRGVHLHSSLGIAWWRTMNDMRFVLVGCGIAILGFAAMSLASRAAMERRR